MARSDSFQHRYGPCALVTGASSGIGEEFARQLAARGLDLVLVARRVDRLTTLAEELRARHGVRVELAPIDLCAPGAVDDVLSAVEPHDVGLVVNNAGFGLKGRFWEIALEEQLRMVRLNCEVPVALIHKLLPRLIARGRGGIVVTSSTAAFQATPFATAYAATKGFDMQLAEGLWYELQAVGIDALALCPGPTDTEGPRRTGVDPAKVPGGSMAVGPVVDSAALATLGHGPIAVPGARNRLLAFATRLIPRSLTTRAAGRLIARATGLST